MTWRNRFGVFWHRPSRVFWFRVFGWGLHFKPSRLHIPLFSERYGYAHCWYVGPLRVMLLRPTRPVVDTPAHRLATGEAVKAECDRQVPSPFTSYVPTVSGPARAPSPMTQECERIKRALDEHDAECERAYRERDAEPERKRVAPINRKRMLRSVRT